MGQLRNKRPNGSGFRSDDVQRMMRELWVEYVTGNPKLFKTSELGVPIPERLDFDWPNASRNHSRDMLAFSVMATRKSPILRWSPVRTG